MKPVIHGRDHRAGGADPIPFDIASVPPTAIAAYACRVRRSTGLTVVDGFSFTSAIEWDTEDYDFGDFHSSGDNTKLVAPVDGIYIAWGTFNITTSNAGDYGIGLLKNGSQPIGAEVEVALSGQYNASIQVVYADLCAAGDYWQMRVAQKTGANRTLDHTGTAFGIILLGAVPV